MKMRRRKTVKNRQVGLCGDMNVFFFHTCHGQCTSTIHSGRQEVVNRSRRRRLMVLLGTSNIRIYVLHTSPSQKRVIWDPMICNRRITIWWMIFWKKTSWCSSRKSQNCLLVSTSSTFPLWYKKLGQWCEKRKLLWGTLKIGPSLRLCRLQTTKSKKENQVFLSLQIFFPEEGTCVQNPIYQSK